MTVKEVSANKFDALMNKRIDLNKCPRCHAIEGEIIIPLIRYGSKCRKVYVRCKQCGFETKRYDANKILIDTENNRIATILLDKSLMKAIYNAVNDWNGRSNNEI